MKLIEINAARCQSVEDFYRLLLAELGAPEWHGHNLDALWDSITAGDINHISAPYKVIVGGRQSLAGEITEVIDKIKSLFDEARHARLAEVEFVLV